MSRIIDIFENLLKYNNIEVFIILDINNDIWFKLKGKRMPGMASDFLLS